MRLVKLVKEMNKVSLTWILTWIVIYILDLSFGLKGILCCMGSEIVGNEYYRFFTGLLVHINLFHLWANIMAMYFVCEFLSGIIRNQILFPFSIITGIIANVLFSIINAESYMVGGSPMIFALIGLIIVIQLMRKDLPGFRLGTWYGNWILGYAILGNLPFFSKDGSTFMIHIIGLVVGSVLSVFVLRSKR